MQQPDQWPVLLFAHAAGNLFFTNTDGELWTSNGTPAGNTLLGDFRAVSAIYPRSEDALFTIVTDHAGLELWRTDGTAPGTRRIKAIRSGAGLDAHYAQYALIKNTVHFLADDGVHGSELWRSDGTVGGTYMVKDLNTQDVNSTDAADIRTLMVLGDDLYFSALSDDDNWSLFRSDGTASGTEPLENLNVVLNSVSLDDRLLLFTHSIGESGRTNVDLAVTDGSADGTRMIAEMNAHYDNMHHAVVDGVAYVSFQDGQFWRSDGTECGTFMVDLPSAAPTPFGSVGKVLVFGSYDVQIGFELYGYDTSEAPETPCSQSVAIAETADTSVEDATSRAYPNPFKNNFVFSAGGIEGETTRLQVFTAYGELVEDMPGLEPNTEHRIGQSWPKGIYVLQVTKEQSTERYRVMKE